MPGQIPELLRIAVHKATKTPLSLNVCRWVIDFGLG